jgi:hypothetical protein
LFLRHGAEDVASNAPEPVNCVVGHKEKLKGEGLNRYAENLKRPTPKPSELSAGRLAISVSL